jgi:hypothetical protein
VIGRLSLLEVLCDEAPFRLYSMNDECRAAHVEFPCEFFRAYSLWQTICIAVAFMFALFFVGRVPQKAVETSKLPKLKSDVSPAVKEEESLTNPPVTYPATNEANTLN